MSKVVPILLIVAILAAGISALQPLPDVIAYAALWDAGVPDDSFALWSGLESMNVQWIKECRDAWLETR